MEVGANDSVGRSFKPTRSDQCIPWVTVLQVHRQVPANKVTILSQVWESNFCHKQGFSSRVSSKNDSSRVLNTQQDFSNTNTPNTLHILQCPVKNSYEQLTSLLQKPVPSQIQRKDCYHNHMSNPTAPEPF